MDIVLHNKITICLNFLGIMAFSHSI